VNVEDLKKMRSLESIKLAKNPLEYKFKLEAIAYCRERMIHCTMPVPSAAEEFQGFQYYNFNC
jgi:hypothetical protein